MFFCFFLPTISSATGQPSLFLKDESIAFMSLSLPSSSNLYVFVRSHSGGGPLFLRPLVGVDVGGGRVGARVGPAAVGFSVGGSVGGGRVRAPGHFSSGSSGNRFGESGS